MKKLLAILTSAIVAASTFTACASQSTTPAPESTDTLNVITTIYPIYDWAQNIIGDNADVSFLLNSGADVHSYQATTQDMIAIANCDVLIYVGGESDGWVDDALENATNPDMVIVNLIDTLGDGAKITELVSGMQKTEHSHDHGEDDHDHNHDEDDHDHESEIDEHVWLSVKNAKLFCNAIADAMSTVDASNEADYSANLAVYLDKLETLDASYTQVVSNAKRDTILFGDRFPFRYLVDDYGLNYYAAFSGCSADTEASFETIAFLTEKVNELTLPCVLTIEKSSNAIADTIIANSKDKSQSVLVLNSMQSIDIDDVKEGNLTYLSIMEQNLTAFEQALQ